MEYTLRTLSEAEYRVLKCALAFRQRQLKLIGPRVSIISFLVIGSLLTLTLLVSHEPWLVVTLVWLGIGGVIAPWSYFSARRHLLPIIAPFESALRRNQARVLRIRANEMVDFEEEEDEGAIYAFQLEGSQIIFIEGQDYYPSARFPNTDFSLVEFLAEDGSAVEGVIAKQGKKLKPLRTIPARVKSTLKIPGHLKTISGTLDELEQLLSQ